jgi:hypothetical protein
MSKIVCWGIDEVSKRNLFSLHLGNAVELESQIILPSRCFVCFLGWDSALESADSISQVSEILLRSGCVYLCSWGRGCGRVHDIAEELSVGPNPHPETYPGIMTTWHENDPLDDALWFFLGSTWPDDGYADDCKAAIAITIGLRRDLQERIDFALGNPRQFSTQMLANDNNQSITCNSIRFGTKMKRIGIETTKYSVLIKAVLDRYSGAKVVINGLIESRHPDQWCTNRELQSIRNFLIIENGKEILSFHDHPRDLIAPLDSLPFVKELAARRLLRYRLLDEYPKNRSNLLGRLLSWLKRI